MSNTPKTVVAKAISRLYAETVQAYTPLVTESLEAIYAQCHPGATIEVVKTIYRTGRKYGFPLVHTLDNKSESERIHLAAAYLLNLVVPDGRISKSVVLPAGYILSEDSLLYQDASDMVINADSNTIRLLLDSNEDYQGLTARARFSASSVTGRLA